MNRAWLILFGLLGAAICAGGQTDSQFGVRGQASGWANINPGNEMPVWAGIRYIPQGNFAIPLSENNLIDFELSANISGSSLIEPFSNFEFDSQLKTYRAWGRFSAKQLEIRAGLQKINFGSASMARPLMWFDQLDPRDPLQLTNGVWAILGRYYFIDNTNIWLWVLYGNRGLKTWEIGETSSGTPEYGGRIQIPVPGGEAAVSFHRRKAGIGQSYYLFLADAIDMYDGNRAVNIPENRYGFDAKWDIEIGLWIEGVLIQKQMDLSQLTNQHIFTVGADYTFGLGNGLYLAAEQLLISNGNSTFQLENRFNFTALTVTYPLGIFDNLSAIIYRDWTNGNTYSFLNWHRQFDKFGFYLMAFRNPETFRLPQQSEAAQMFSGRGFQVMLVYNH